MTNKTEQTSQRMNNLRDRTVTLLGDHGCVYWGTDKTPLGQKPHGQNPLGQNPHTLN